MLRISKSSISVSIIQLIATLVLTDDSWQVAINSMIEQIITEKQITTEFRSLQIFEQMSDNTLQQFSHNHYHC
jgi:hypothetical protein